MAVYRSIDNAILILQRDGFQEDGIAIVLSGLLGPVEDLATLTTNTAETIINLHEANRQRS